MILFSKGIYKLQNKWNDIKELILDTLHLELVLRLSWRKLSLPPKDFLNQQNFAAWGTISEQVNSYFYLIHKKTWI